MAGEFLHLRHQHHDSTLIAQHLFLATDIGDT